MEFQTVPHTGLFLVRLDSESVLSSCTGTLHLLLRMNPLFTFLFFVCIITASRIPAIAISRVTVMRIKVTVSQFRATMVLGIVECLMEVTELSAVDVSASPGILCVCGGIVVTDVGRTETFVLFSLEHCSLFVADPGTSTIRPKALQLVHGRHLLFSSDVKCP